MRSRLNKISAVIALSLSGCLLATSANATTVSGVIKDQSGKPIEGVKVRAEGSSKIATTDAQGRYQLADLELSNVHLHAYSPDYQHGDKDMGPITDDTTVNFTLTETLIENIVVRANALPTSVLESVTPVSVIEAKDLRKNQQATLGETLKFTPGVHSSYFGPVAATPIIRGFDGPRVRIVQNNLDVTDVSRSGADHNVAVDTSTATQVEILKGPATLQYGNGAIGGVVNVVDNRIAREAIEGLQGEAEARTSTVNDEKFGKVDLNFGSNGFVAHLDVTRRETDLVDIPGFASLEPDEDEPEGILENSQVDFTRVVAGLSYVGEDGYIGFSVEQLDNLYGVPGHDHDHGHGGHDDHGGDHDDHDGDHDEDEHGEEEGVSLDVDMTRYQLAGEWYSPFAKINSIRLDASYVEYNHLEREGELFGTEFSNEGVDTRLTINHDSLAGWHGSVGLHYTQSDYAAIGEEAFAPPSDTTNLALFVIERKQVGDISFEVGGRIERTKYSADPIDVTLGELEDMHGGHHDEHHDEDHHDEGHDDDHHDDHDDDHHDDHDDGHHDEDHEEVQNFVFGDLAFTSISLSAGMNWEYTEGQTLGLQVSRNERAPSPQELFSGGRHIATGTYELGLVFDLQGDELEDGFRLVEQEVSNNIDLTFRKFSGDWGYSVSLFYNDIENFIYQEDTGFVFNDDHGHDDHGDDHDDHGDDHDEHGDEHDDDHHDDHGEDHEDEGYPVLYFQQDDARIYGVEAQGFLNIDDAWRITVFGDYIRAKIDHDNLPRIPPMRLGGELSYNMDGWDGNISTVWYDDQNDTAQFETRTRGYMLWNAGLRYSWEAADTQWTAFFEAQNITNEEARVHTSFLKDQAPLPGRNLSLGIRATF